MILLEKIDDMRKFYPKLTDEQFNQCIELDPTYKKGSDKAGTYAKWILGLANRGKLDNVGHIKDLLQRFEDNKNNLVDKNIMRFTTIVDLEDYLNDESSYKKLSARQELRKTQKAVHNTDIEKDADLVFSSSSWEVWVPKTYEASCKLGRGTTWCTASTESNYYYNNYTKDGPLYINLSKNSDDKFQFHFPSRQYMDKDDKEIYISDFLEKNKDLKDFYYDTIAKEVFLMDGDEASFVLNSYDLERIFEHVIGGRNTLNGDTAFQLISDAWEVAVDWDFTNMFNPEYVPALNSTSVELLYKLTGLSEEEAKEIIQSQDYSSEYYDVLFTAYAQGTDDGYLNGAAAQAHNDALNALYKCFGEGWEVKWTGEELQCKVTKNAIVRDYISDEIDAPEEYSSDPAEDLMYCIIRSKYELRDPYNGWDDFDEDSFNTIFQERLKEELGE